MSYGHLVPEEAPLRDHGSVVPVLAGDGHQGEPALLDPALHHLPTIKVATTFRGVFAIFEIYYFKWALKHHVCTWNLDICL